MSYRIELRHLHYFRILAEELHFRKAADRLFISQPGLSKQIKSLEDSLQVDLLKRSKRTVSLTPAGAYLFDRVIQMENQMEEVIHGVRLVHSGHKGNLRIGYIGSAMQNIIPKLMKSIDKDFIDIQFDLSEMGNLLQVESLLHHQIDLGFVRMEHVPNPLRSLMVFEDTFSLVLPLGHPIEEKSIDDLVLVKNEKFILFESSYSASYYRKVMSIFDDAGFIPKVAHHSIHANSIFRMVASGFGVAIVPTSLQFGYDLQVKFVELKFIKQRAALSAVWNPNNANPVVANVIQLLESADLS